MFLELKCFFLVGLWEGRKIIHGQRNASFLCEENKNFLFGPIRENAMVLGQMRWSMFLVNISASVLAGGANGGGLNLSWGRWICEMRFALGALVFSPWCGATWYNGMSVCFMRKSRIDWRGQGKEPQINGCLKGFEPVLQILITEDRKETAN